MYTSNIFLSSCEKRCENYTKDEQFSQEFSQKGSNKKGSEANDLLPNLICKKNKVIRSELLK